MIFRGSKYSVLLCLVVFLHACGPGRVARESLSLQPDWVRSRPVVPGHYIGIGWAQKTANIQFYQQSAKQNALADLASEITVSISLNSVLHAFESNLGFREDFSSTIQARTQEELEGFELAGTWEDQDNYWIYYRLSAARHSEIKERRKNDAVSRAAGLLENALTSREQGNLRQSLIHLTGSLEAIKNYFDQPLPIELRGESIQLGSRIFEELSTSISSIEITPHQREIEIKNGRVIPSSMLTFRLTSRGEPVAGFPLIATYSERPLRNSTTRSDNNGNAGMGIDRVRSTRNFETFSLRPDIANILAEATSDPVIRRMISRFSLPEGEIRINILPPVIWIDASEKMAGRESGSNLADSFRRNGVEAGYHFSNNYQDADFIVRIHAEAVFAGEAGTFKNAVLQGNIQVETADGNMLYQRELEGFRGAHFDPDHAADEAYRQAVRRLNSSFFREIDDILKGRSGAAGSF